MRLLVACPKCNRQFDATGKSVGDRFRCHCGAVVTIHQPNGHEASVVRCSSCGGPRSEGSAACAYCGADFTLHEQDLDTICPGCLARVSDRAKFCHHCGIALTPEPLAGESTTYTCPACGNLAQLTNRQIGDVALLECGRCAGFWVATNVFEGLVERAAKDSLDPDWHLPAPRRDVRWRPGSEQSGSYYRQCPFCGEMMNRTNFGGRSGIIIDTCRDHGAWFDADELATVMIWVRSGGLIEAQRRKLADAERKEREEKRIRANQKSQN